MNVASLLKTAIIAVCLSAATFAPVARADIKLNGSGASFPFPIYSMWFKDFSKAHRDIRVDYQSKGSGAGIRDFINQVVDFAGSDAAMSDEEIAKAKNGVVLLPMTAGEIVLTYNLKGVDQLKLPRDVYPEIFMGKITQWNDPKIAAANPGVELPDQDITVVVRSDSSGTTYVFTGHLSAINEEFKNTVGQGKTPQWPKSNKFVKAPKNDGITATVKQTPGAIGYIEYGYAKLTKAPVAMLENKEGKFVSPGPESGAAALSSAEFPSGSLPGSNIPDLRVWVYDPSGKKAYPIATFTWLIFPRKMEADKAKASHKLVEYCLTEGQKSADALGYIPLPENVVDKVRTVAQNIQGK
jgi:phosphate transport system substrate-binding protein